MDFQHPYNRKNFISFVRNFLPEDFIDQEKESGLAGRQARIKNVIELGSTKALQSGGQALKVYEVWHESENDPRVTLTREFFKVMRDQLVTRALIAFVSKKSKNYRFSLMTVDLIADGKRIKKNFSNPRRYSFYLGPDAKVRTPHNMLIKKGRVSDFDDLLSRFSLEVVTREFYRELCNWYFWALQKTRYPDDVEQEKNGKNMAMIRLITRLVFIWFMKQKGLVPDFLFKKDEIKKILKNISQGKSTYYKAILQNLFFATLNTPIKQRRFRDNHSRPYPNKHFMEHSVYRYEKCFKKPKEILNLFKDIPFLNGGLFECLDKKMEKNEKMQYVRLDGFSDRADNLLNIPNELFFSDEIEADLNKEYGTKNKKYKTRGLLNILQSYNFTIDENTPLDEEVSLDPELLGRVFENLLASYNPETATTARKATGSYYTPRQIVDYMVDESLKEYFKTKIKTKNIDKKLKELFSYSSESHSFSEKEKIALINATASLKIIDPAVGSGAFPMGILQKLVYILSKLDPRNKLWKQEQIEAVERSVTDVSLKKKLIEKIENDFKNNELDYGRKLYLIQNCIYGVDIQPIAIQIAKLRFFISLLVNMEDNKIEPLPNLETKFVSANSLIGLDIEKQGALFKTPEIAKLEQELKQVRDKYFNANYRNEKDRLRKKDKQIRQTLAKLSLSKFSPQATQKIINWDPYDPNTSSGWFDSEWMFGVRKGFDIVIGNPPYIDSEAMTKGKQKKLRESIAKTFKLTKGNWDIYIAFFELGFNVLSKEGVLVFITPDKWISKPFGNELRTKTIDNIYSILRAGRKVFESSNVDSIISLFRNRHCKYLKILNFENNCIMFKDKIHKKRLQFPFTFDFLFSDHLKFLLKIENFSNKVSDLANCESACATSDAYKLKPLIQNLYKNNFDSAKQLKVINTGTIGKYVSKWGNREMTYLKDKYLFPVVAKQKFFNLFKNSYAKKAIQPKIIIKGLTLLDGCLDIDGSILPGKSTLIITNDDINKLKFLLAILNSKLMLFYIKEKYPASSYNKGINFTKDMINNFPIPEMSKSQQKPFINLANKILAITKSPDYLQNPNKQAKVKKLEAKIDQLVYGLYGLTEGEIKIVEQTNQK